MKNSWLNRRNISFLIIVGLAACSTAQVHQHNLVSDGIVGADVIDPDLKNPWGVSMSSTSPFWVSNQVTGNSTLYNTNGVKQSLTVATTPNPTGQVFNSSGTGFDVGGGNPARFMFCTLEGKITAWNPAISPTQALIMSDNVGSVFTGLTLADNKLFIANFATGGVDVFDNSFSKLASLTDPNAPSGFSPYNVRAINNLIYVTYAKEDSFGGFVDQFDLNGNFVRRLVTDNARLAEAWGMEIAPSSWGTLAGALLVGNVHTGLIHAFDNTTGAYLATIQENGHDLVNDGLRTLTVGNGGNGGDPNKVYFTAGLNDEQDGLFGSLEIVPDPATLLTLSVGLLALAKKRRRA